MSPLDVALLAALLVVGAWRLLAAGLRPRMRLAACGLVAVLAVVQVLALGFTWQFVTGYILLVVAAIPVRPDRRLLAVLATVGVGLLLLATVAPFALLPTPALPQPTGPYAVGTRTWRWVDPARAEEATADPADLRNVVVQAWYPAPPGTTGPRAPYMDGLGRLPAKIMVFPRFVFGRFDRVDTHAVAGAQVAASGQAWPVVIFSPGYGAPRAVYAGLLAELASRGFVVLAMDHPYEVAVTQLASGRVVGPAQVFPARDEDWVIYMDRQVHVRAADVGFVLSQLPKVAPQLRADPARVAAIGHSFGGATAAVAAAQDPRIRAASDIDGALYGAVWEQSLEVPFLLVESDRGETGHGQFYLDGTATLFENLQAPGWRYQIHHANHFSFTDATLYFSPPARSLLALAMGGSRGATRTQRETADILQAFLTGRGVEAAAGRHPGITGGRVR